MPGLPVITLTENARVNPVNPVQVSPQRIPLVLHMPQQPLPQPLPLPLPLPPLSPQAPALPDQEELAIRGRVRVFTSSGLRLRALLEELEWTNIFGRLPPNDPQSQMDALAILLLSKIRPAMLAAPEGSAQQSQALDWELEMEKIFAELWPDVEFEAFIDECDALMREEELTNALCTRLEHTALVQNRVFAALETNMHASIDQVFTFVRERLIVLQNARRTLNREIEARVDVVVNRTNQVAQDLLNQSTAIEELSQAIITQEESSRQALMACKTVLEGPL